MFLPYGKIKKTKIKKTRAENVRYMYVFIILRLKDPRVSLKVLAKLFEGGVDILRRCRVVPECLALFKTGERN